MQHHVVGRGRDAQSFRGVVSMLRSRNISRLIARYRSGKPERDVEESADGRSREAGENRQETLSDVGVIGSPIIAHNFHLFVVCSSSFFSFITQLLRVSRTCSGRGLRTAARCAHS